ncbi:MAG: biotin transporter BioY [Candidatus Limnocylindria bacterium]
MAMSSSGAAASAARQVTLVDVVVPARGTDRTGAILRAIVLVAAGAALTALSAQVSFRVPWTEVPYTGQTAAVLLVGTALGWRLGAASMALYLLVGVAGAPVFSSGAHGMAQLLGATGGYLAGFVLAAAMVGRLAERGWDRSPLSAAGLMAAGNLLIYAVGVPVLAWTTGMGAGDAVWRGAAVFLPWDAFKVLLAAGLLPLAWRALERQP